MAEQSAVHIRDQDGQLLCGIAELPKGDTWLYVGSVADADATCLLCNPNPRPIGTPLSELSGRPGSHAFDRFTNIAASWRHD